MEEGPARGHMSPMNPDPAGAQVVSFRLIRTTRYYHYLLSGPMALHRRDGRISPGVMIILQLQLRFPSGAPKTTYHWCTFRDTLAAISISSFG